MLTVQIMLKSLYVGIECTAASYFGNSNRFLAAVDDWTIESCEMPYALRGKLSETSVIGPT